MTRLSHLGGVQRVAVSSTGPPVAPLGPDFSRALGIPMSQVAYIVGAYTASAAFAGLAGSLFLDRFDRKRALVVALLGLASGTLLCGAAIAVMAVVELVRNQPLDLGHGVDVE